MKYGSWWAIQRNNGFSLGFHLDPRRRTVAKSGTHYGPYFDLHVACWVISVGVNPIFAGEIDLLQSFSRGGINGDRN